MSKLHPPSLRLVMTFLIVIQFSLLALGYSSTVHAADEDKAADAKAAIEEQLAEAQRLLEADMASQKETEAKRQAIEDKLAARKEREQEILSELEQLCEEQETISPGSLDSCMAKLNN